MTEACAHSNLFIAASILTAEGAISGYEAVYDLTCPRDGQVRRNTRLAATIHTLRHEFGWRIETTNEEGRLATYTLVQRTPFPKTAPDGVSSNTPRDPKVHPTVADVPVTDIWTCVWSVRQKDGTSIECGMRTKNVIERMLGGWAIAQCELHGRCPHRPVKEQQSAIPQGHPQG